MMDLDMIEDVFDENNNIKVCCC